MDHPLGGYGVRPSGYVLEISSLAEALFDEAKGCDDSAKLTERLTLKVYGLMENKKLTEESKNRGFSTQQINEQAQLPTDMFALAQHQPEWRHLNIQRHHLAHFKIVAQCSLRQHHDRVGR